MRIGINASFLRKPYTGMGQVTAHTLEFLPRRKGVEYVLYFEERPDVHAEWLERDDISVRYGLPTGWRRDDLVRKVLWERSWLPRRVRHDRCDVLVSLYQSSTVLPADIRHIMVVHDIIPRLFPEYLNNTRKRLYQRLVDRAIRRAAEIVTVSEWSRQDIVRVLGIPEKRVSVAYIDVDPAFKETVPEECKADVLRRYHLAPGYVYAGGGLEMRKNIPTLLRAYRRLVDQGITEGAVPPLVISGKLLPRLAPLITDVESLVHEMDLGPYVRVLGFVPQADLPALYASAEMFVYPSVYEGFGMPVLEAMNQGVPVVCSQASSLREVGGSAVEYFDPANVEELVAKMRMLLEDMSQRKELDRRGREQARKFSWERFAEALVEKAIENTL